MPAVPVWNHESIGGQQGHIGREMAGNRRKAEPGFTHDGGVE